MSGSEKKKRGLQHWQIIAIYLIVYDSLAANASYLIGLLLRFDFHYTMIPEEFLSAWLHFIPIYTIFCILAYWKLHLYNSLWRYASFDELTHIVVANIITALFHIFGIVLLFHKMPISYFFVGAVCQFFLTVIIRFGYRYMNLQRSRLEKSRTTAHNVMVIGAGAAGRTIIRELGASEKLNSTVCCVIDDNPNKWNRFIEGIKIVGGRDFIMKAVEEYQIDQIMVAIPTASASQKRDILNICKETGCELKSLPGIYQLANGEVLLSKMKTVAIEDLLGRDPIKVDLTDIYQYIAGKVILVTGGGGSIGSELCRQIAAHHPKQLIIFDVYENNAYEIEQELKRKYGTALNLVTLIGSVRDSRRIDMVFKTYRPEIVFHAAAHKHVPLMETSPNEAIKNNVCGTYKTAYAALKYHAKRFVLISTDKAVNPTNIMGASKRLCEMIVQSMDTISREGRMDLLPLLRTHVEKTLESELKGDSSVSLSENATEFFEADPVSKLDLGEIGNEKEENRLMTSRDLGDNSADRTIFGAVRFGNVLGSNGSVIPLFKKQIEAGGPVTVTHPDIVRYFMTIPEAVSLVLEAAAKARGGEIFVLDMGEAVKIDTLARNLIKLSGYEPDVDIKVEYTGLRPGEKLYEEKLMAEEGIRRTSNDLIHIGNPIAFDIEVFLKQLEEIAVASYDNDPEIVEKVASVVPTFHPVGEHPEETMKQNTENGSQQHGLAQ